MRFGQRAVLAGGLGFAVSLIAACGGGAGLLSGSQSSAMNSQLDAISQALSDGQCGAPLSSAVSSFNEYVSGLPSKVNAALRANLLQGASTVSQLAAQGCTTAAATTTTTSQSSSTSTSSSSTTPTTTTSSTTTSTPTSTSTSTSTTTTDTTTSSSSSSTTPTSSTTSTAATDTTTSGTGTSSQGGSGGAGIGGNSGNTGNGAAGVQNGNGQ